MVKLLLKFTLKIMVLLIIVLIMALSLSWLLRPDRPSDKDDTKSKVLGFYELEKNSLDVLFLGSSHVYYAVNPAIINEKNDLNSYVFAGECQPIEVTYYFLKEALKTQKPKLVVFDVFGLSESINACKTEGIIRVNIENLKTSLNKIEAYKDNFGEENLIYNIFDVSLYHNRWFELFNKKKKINKADFGYTMSTHFSENVVDINQENSEESEKVDTSYLDKMIELCKNENIEFLLIKTPYYLSETDAKIYNFIRKNYPDFIDFNRIRDEINYVFDVDGDIWHANVLGANKISEYLADYINKYNIKKTSDIYDDDYYKMLCDIKKVLYSRENKIDEIIKNIHDNNHILLMNYNYFEGDALKEKDKVLLEEIGYDFTDANKKAIYKVENKKVDVYKSNEYFYKEFVLGDNIFKVESNGYMWKNGIGLNVANNYACITVIDEINYEVLDSFCMDTFGDLYIHRDKETK